MDFIKAGNTEVVSYGTILTFGNAYLEIPIHNEKIDVILRFEFEEREDDLCLEIDPQGELFKIVLNRFTSTKEPTHCGDLHGKKLYINIWVDYWPDETTINKRLTYALYLEQ